MRCIYCIEPISGPQPDEHVFPYAFGCPDSFVLKCVCGKCNGTLNRDVDQQLVCDSVETAMRNQLLPSRRRTRKHSKREEKEGKRRFVPFRHRIILRGGQYGHFEGVIMQLTSERPGLLLLPPQLVLTDSTNRRHHFTRDMLAYPQTRDFAMSLPRKMWEIFAERAEREEFGQWLVTEGILDDAKPEGDEGPPDGAFIRGELADARIEAQIDTTIQRGLAKIAYNYLAFVGGWETALDPAFDEIRKYIRTREGGAFVRLTSAPATNAGSATPDGAFFHMLLLRHDFPSKHDLQMGLVLFSAMSYQIRLTNRFHGAIPDTGHAFLSKQPEKMLVLHKGQATI